jgi:predicted HicB family RNase H-like nuclease
MAATNITIRVDSKLALAAKVLAARRGTSVSRLVSEQLEVLVQRDRAYEAAKRRARVA